LAGILSSIDYWYSLLFICSFVCWISHQWSNRPPRTFARWCLNVSHASLRFGRSPRYIQMPDPKRDNGSVFWPLGSPCDCDDFENSSIRHVDQVLYLSQDYLPLIISFLHFCGTVHEIHTGANTLSHCQQLPSKYS